MGVGVGVWEGSVGGCVRVWEGSVGGCVRVWEWVWEGSVGEKCRRVCEGM